MPLFMAITITGIALFQMQWLRNTYVREKRTLSVRTNMAFRETVQDLQASKLKLDKLLDSARLSKLQIKVTKAKPTRIRIGPDDRLVELMNIVGSKAKEGLPERRILLTEAATDDTAQESRMSNRRRNRMIQFLYDLDSEQDTIKINEIYAAYNKRLHEQNINVPFNITRLTKPPEDKRNYGEVVVGIKNPITYRLTLGNTFSYLTKRIASSILLSFFIVGFTLFSFLLLYRNLIHQQRLANIKNDFISNITHELKTPIATVSVAIEALRNFNASMDPVKTKEYLDISANELQRLSLLVDKVLKLSMFEKKEVNLRYEAFDIKDVVAEVTSSMRLQFEKYGAQVAVITEGDTTIEGDRLHLVSVVYNLLDNALKYSSDNVKIDITIKGSDDNLTLSVQDNGIGIPVEYKDKVFDKFFRVPTGNIHNAKGYGLGLSYVAQVVAKHKGSIKVQSSEGNGSNFIITLPKKEA